MCAGRRVVKSVCPYPGCSTLTEGGRCAEHQAVAQSLADQRRGSAAKRGYDANWKRLRDYKLSTDPVCQIRKLCAGDYATEVDHIIPIQDRPDLRLEYSNLQSACGPCNVSKQTDDAKLRKQKKL